MKKGCGIAALIFAVLNFLGCIMAASQGATEAAAKLLQGALMLGVIGGLFLHFASRAKKKEEERKKFDGE